MIERRTSADGPVYYISPLLERIGVAHAFSTRLGGISPAPFVSLNLGNPSGCAEQDDRPRIVENYRLLQAAIGCADRDRLSVHQIHGGQVISAMRGSGFQLDTKGDALFSDDPSKVLAVRIADCVPVLVASTNGKIVAAIHAGWRGVVAGVVGNTIERFSAVGCRAVSLVAAIGPCIGEEAFEVGLEVVAEFERVFGADAPARRTADGKGRVDLRRAVKLQLLNAGIVSDRIDTTDRCTFRDVDEFFSHRRDNGITGRMAALIAPVR